MANLTLTSNSVLSSSLLDSTSEAKDVFALTIPDGEYSIEATSLLVTVNLQITEAFTSGQDWSLWLQVGDNYLAPINSSDLASGFDDSGLLSYQFVVEPAGDGWPTLAAFVQTEDGSAFSSSAYELSFTTLSLFEEGAYGRLVEGQAIQGEANSDSDEDTFGFYVESGEATTASITFSEAGTVSISSASGPLATVGLDEPQVDGISVAAGQTLEFRLDGSQAFVSVDYLCSWIADPDTGIKAPSQNYTLTLDGGAGRIMPAPTLRVGDTVVQDSAITDASAELQFSSIQTYDLSDIFSVSEGVAQLQLIADSADSIFIQLGSDTEIAVSTDASTPTTVQVSDLTDTTIRAVTGTSSLTSYAELNTELALSGTESLFRSGVVQSAIESQAQGVSIAFESETLQEGSSGTVTVTLDQAAASDIDIFLNNASGDLVFGDGNSYATVTVLQGQTTTSEAILVTAVGGDTDFVAAESVELTAEVTTSSLSNLVVAPAIITVTDVLPEFTIRRVQQELLVLDGDRNQFDLTLTNAADFTDGDVTIDFGTNDKFAVVDASGEILSSLTFTSSEPTQSVYVKISGVGVADSESSSLTATVKVANVDANVTLPTMPILRVSETEIDSPFTLSGTSGDDVFYGTPESNVTFEGKGGNDVLAIGSVTELAGVFDAGLGNDSVLITGAKADFKTSFSDGATYLTLADNSLEGGLQLIGVESVVFSETSEVTYAVSELNSAPTATSPTSVTVEENGSAVISLSTLLTDPDNDALTYRLKYNGSVNDVPDWISINSLTSELEISPGFEDSGEYVLSVEATDKSVFPASPASHSLTVTVSDVNRAPIESAAISSQFIPSNSSANWSLNLLDYFDDPDGDTLTFELSVDTPDWVSLSDGLVTVSGNSLPLGSDFVGVSISDGNEGVITSSFEIEIGDTPGIGIDRAIAGRPVELNVSELEAAYQLDPSTDVSVKWETTSDLENWQVSTQSTGTSISLPASSSGPVFVRATATFQVEGVSTSVVSTPELIKSDAAIHADIIFKSDINVYLTEAVDFSAIVTGSSGATENLVGSGYDLSSFSADALPSGNSFEISADAQSYLAPDVGISDVIASLRHIVKLDVLEGKAAIAADMDGSGDIGISDVISQLRQIVKLEDSSGFKAVAQTADGYTDQLTADLLNSELEWVAMGDVDSSYTLDIV